MFTIEDEDDNSPINVGDKVICCISEYNQPLIQKGSIYTVHNITYGNCMSGKLTDLLILEGLLDYCWDVARFKKCSK